MSENVKVTGESALWEVLNLIAGYMDGKTLIIASCVSKTWSRCFSSDHLYRPLFTTRHPSLSTVAAGMKTSQAISYKRLYSTAESAAKRRRDIRNPAKPKISLRDLTFITHLSNKTANLKMVKHGKDIVVPSNGLFMLNLDDNHSEGSKAFVGEVKNVKVTLHVVYKEWESIFTMVDCVTSLKDENIFFEEIPAPESSVFSRGSGLNAEVTLEITGDVTKLDLAIMNTVDLRYLNLGDGLRYLERFLLTQGRK